MYSAGNAQPGSGVARTSLPVIAAICCGATLLLLLAATIVLALIPLYVPNKTLTKASTTSDQSTVYLPTGDSRRKRDQGLGVGDAAAANSQITETQSLTEIQDALFGVVSKSGYAKSFLVDSCSMVLLSSKRRRRDGISKRAYGLPCIKCLYRVVYVDKCTASSCQSLALGLVTGWLQNESEVKKIRLTKLFIWINGVRYYFPCGFIGAGRVYGPGQKDNQPTLPSTTTATTPTTSPGISG